MAVVFLVVMGAPDAMTAQPAEVRSFRELGFDDATARGMYGTLEYSFTVPPGRQPRPGAAVELVISHSPLLLPNRSTMTVVVDGRSVTSAFLTAENRDRGLIAVPLPVDAGDDGYVVQVRFLLRLTHDACEDPRDPALWATVHGDSRLTLPTEPSAQTPDLGDLARQMVRDAGSGEAAPLAMVLPDPDRSLEALRAAGLVAFQYGRWAGRANADSPIEVAATSSSDPGAAVLVGTGASLPQRASVGPLRWDGAAFVGPGGAVPADYGVLGLTRSSPPALVVTGATPESVLMAAEALVQPERRDALRGDHVVVTGETPAWNPGVRPWRESAASFAQLGVGRREFVGPGLHTVRFYFERPPGWILEEGGTLELAVETTAAVRAETSWIAVRLNGIDIGARPLDQGGGRPGRYLFELPADRLNVDLNGQPQRPLALEVQLYLDLPRAGCADAPADGVRAALLADSAWRLPHSEYPGLDLGRFPAMFFDDRAPIAVVLPERADSEHLAAGLAVMAALGRWSGSDEAAWPHLVTADALTDRERRDAHLIPIGGPEVNRLSEEARRKNRNLFPDEPPPLLGGDGSGSARWGRLQLERSPWGRGRVLLALDGLGDDGLRLAADALARTAALSQIRGKVVVLSPGLPPQTLAGADPPEQPPPALAPRTTTPFRDRVEPWQVAGAALLGGFVATVAVVLVRRRGRT